jgi:hypothetical protein
MSGGEKAVEIAFDDPKGAYGWCSFLAPRLPDAW